MLMERCPPDLVDEDYRRSLRFSDIERHHPQAKEIKLDPEKGLYRGFFAAWENGWTLSLYYENGEVWELARYPDGLYEIIYPYLARAVMAGTMPTKWRDLVFVPAGQGSIPISICGPDPHPTRGARPAAALQPARHGVRPEYRVPGNVGKPKALPKALEWAQAEFEAGNIALCRQGVTLSWWRAALEVGYVLSGWLWTTPLPLDAVRNTWRSFGDTRHALRAEPGVVARAVEHELGVVAGPHRIHDKLLYLAPLAIARAHFEELSQVLCPEAKLPEWKSAQDPVNLDTWEDPLLNRCRFLITRKDVADGQPQDG